MSNSALAHEPAAALRGVRRSLFLAELGVCFGPCSVMALASVLTFGPALGLVLQKLFGAIEPINDVPWWAAIQPMFLSVGAFAGLKSSRREIISTCAVPKMAVMHPPRLVCAASSVFSRTPCSQAPSDLLRCRLRDGSIR